MAKRKRRAFTEEVKAETVRWSRGGGESGGAGARGRGATEGAGGGGGGGGGGVGGGGGGDAGRAPPAVWESGRARRAPGAGAGGGLQAGRPLDACAWALRPPAAPVSDHDRLQSSSGGGPQRA